MKVLVLHPVLGHSTEMHTTSEFLVVG